MWVLTALIGAEIRQPEVDVVERSAGVLLGTGSPYLARTGERVDVNPYPPGMAVFGLPRQLLGDSLPGDARLWFLAVFVGTLAAASARAHATPPGAPVTFGAPVAALLVNTAR